MTKGEGVLVTRLYVSGSALQNRKFMEVDMPVEMVEQFNGGSKVLC